MASTPTAHQFPATASGIGFGGPGVMLFLKEFGYPLPTWVVVIAGIVSVIALVVAAVQIFQWFWHKSKILGSTSARRNLIPWMLGAMGLAGAILVAAAVAGTIAYYNSPQTVPKAEFDEVKQKLDTAQRTPVSNQPSAHIVADKNEHPIAWNKDPVLSINSPGSELIVTEIGWTGVNVSAAAITLDDAYVISAIIGAKVVLKVSTQEGLLLINEINPVPPKASITLFEKINISEKQFLVDWATFDFVVNVNGVEHIKTVERPQIIMMFGERRMQMGDGLPINREPRVTKRK